MSRDAKDAVVAALAFLERNKNAAMLTYDASTGMPVFAHHYVHTRWQGRDYPMRPEDGLIVEFVNAPTPETRRQEERIREAIVFDDIIAGIPHARLPDDDGAAPPEKETPR